MNDIVINKIQSIQRCVRRAREEYQADRDGFTIIHQYTKADLRIVEAVIVSELVSSQ